MPAGYFSDPRSDHRGPASGPPRRRRAGETLGETLHDAGVTSDQLERAATAGAFAESTAWSDADIDRLIAWLREGDG